MNKIKRIWALINKRGSTYFITECIDRIVDIYYELYLNIDTVGFVFKEELGSTCPDSNEYASVNYRYIIGALRSLEADITSSVLLDYGCGKGRVLAYAASCNFKKIIGIENSILIDVARGNIRTMKRQKTTDISLEKCDAQNFKVPSSVNTIFFYNPFIGSILKSVLENIYLSWKESPRKISIIFFNNDEFERLITHQKWIKRIHQTQPHPDFSCGIYETESSQYLI
ncbi:hypothetical protein OAB45_00580 [Gammaproteobacteria bacterium]|nr:hypothetical protein [Gammaproteobacteria bacterium]